MVRLSDIFRPKPESKAPPSLPEKVLRKEQKRISETQIIKVPAFEEVTAVDPGDRFKPEVKAHFESLSEKSRDIRNKVKNNMGISPSPILSSLHDILDGELVDDVYEYAVAVPQDDELALHAIAVTLGSLRLGRGLKYDTRDLLRLGLAAFLENVGMYKVPENILNKENQLRDDDIAEIKKHPETSARILGAMGEAFQWLAEVALQIHERWDGSGYPRGLKGEEILEFASIIGLMDTYVAMIKNRPYRQKHIQTDAVRSIVGIDKGKFSPRVMKEFFNQITMFPINTYVKLNNKSIGRVSATDNKQPLRPTVELLYDGLGQRMDPGSFVNLADSPLLHIVETIDDNKIG